MANDAIRTLANNLPTTADQIPKQYRLDTGKGTPTSRWLPPSEITSAPSQYGNSPTHRRWEESEELAHRPSDAIVAPVVNGNGHEVASSTAVVDETLTAQEIAVREISQELFEIVTDQSLLDDLGIFVGPFEWDLSQRIAIIDIPLTNDETAKLSIMRERGDRNVCIMFVVEGLVKGPLVFALDEISPMYAREFEKIPSWARYTMYDETSGEPIVKGIVQKNMIPEDLIESTIIQAAVEARLDSIPGHILQLAQESRLLPKSWHVSRMVATSTTAATREVSMRLLCRQNLVSLLLANNPKIVTDTSQRIPESIGRLKEEIAREKELEEERKQRHKAVGDTLHSLQFLRAQQQPPQRRTLWRLQNGSLVTIDILNRTTVKAEIYNSDGQLESDLGTYQETSVSQPERSRRHWLSYDGKYHRRVDTNPNERIEGEPNYKDMLDYTKTKAGHALEPFAQRWGITERNADFGLRYPNRSGIKDVGGFYDVVESLCAPDGIIGQRYVVNLAYVLLDVLKKSGGYEEPKPAETDVLENQT